MTYEDLIMEAENNNILIVEKKFKSDAKGLCKNNKIGINKYIDSSAEKLCILAEELGHYYTTVGDILDQSDIRNVKQERVARAWAYNKLIPFEAIKQAHCAGYVELYDMAEYLDVNEAFLRESLDYYRQKHGDELIRQRCEPEFK